MDASEIKRIIRTNADNYMLKSWIEEMDKSSEAYNLPRLGDSC